MEKIKILTASGPVSYPMIAARDPRFEIAFSKEGDANVVLDSSVSMIRRGLKANVSLISGLAGFMPKIGKKIAIWRKGSSSDILTRAILNLKGLKSEIIYVEDATKIGELLSSGEADSAVTSAANGKIITFEELLAEHGIEVPGSCVAKVSDSARKEFLEAYAEGFRRFRENPEESSNYVASILPMKTSPEFIRNAILNTKSTMKEIKNDEAFTALVKKFL